MLITIPLCSQLWLLKLILLRFKQQMLLRSLTIAEVVRFEWKQVLSLLVSIQPAIIS
ncbi:MAG: hypothetical protein V7L00_13815 [Nostoc sp.]|uniref:hypothetical protein n=1 Tax=Nostoc sp. TaxID=1180 RepID=UPI002FFC638F